MPLLGTDVPMLGTATIGEGPSGEFSIKVESQMNFKYDYTFLDDDTDTGCFDVKKPYLAERFRAYGRCVVVIDARVYSIYGEEMRKYYKHHNMDLKVLELGIDEEQKSLKTIEDVMVFFAEVGLMRREMPLLVGGGLITDIVGTACSLYRRSTSYVRLPTTLIGMIDASIAIKVGGNLCECYKNRIGAFHPHDGVIIDFHLLKTLPEAHVRNGIAELTKISVVEQKECFELLEKHAEDLIKCKFGYAPNSPPGLREIGRQIARKAVHKMLELECPNLLEHDQRRAIAYGHTWSPVYELTPKPHPMHHGHAISVDMCFSATWAAKEGWISTELRDRIHAHFRRVGLSLMHPAFTVDQLHYGTTAIMQRRDGDLFAAIPDQEIGVCRFVMLGDFGGDRAALDASLEAGLKAHVELVSKLSADGGIGKECYITEGFGRNSEVSKLELGTWAERLAEMIGEFKGAQSFVSVNKKATEILKWWDLTAAFLEQNSSPLPASVARILKATIEESPFPKGMSVDWALDSQSAQTLDFFADLFAQKEQSEPGKKKRGLVAWDLGTLTGISAAVLASRIDYVQTVEREPQLAAFARKHLPKNCEVIEGEIETFLENQAIAGRRADIVFMDLDKPLYKKVYEILSREKLVRPGGLILVDNVLYRGLVAQSEKGEMPAEVSAKTRGNAEALSSFLGDVRADVAKGSVKSLMMPVRDGMLAVKVLRANQRLTTAKAGGHHVNTMDSLATACGGIESSSSEGSDLSSS